MPNVGCESNWKNIPNLWPNLQVLRLSRADRLTLEKLLDIIRRLPHFEELAIPVNLLDLEKYHQLEEVFNRKFPTLDVEPLVNMIDI